MSKVITVVETYNRKKYYSYKILELFNERNCETIVMWYQKTDQKTTWISSEYLRQARAEATITHQRWHEYQLYR